MSKRYRKRLTLEEHRFLAAKLREMRQVFLTFMVSGIYPKKTSQLHVAKKAFNLIDEFRFAMEDRLFIEHPDEATVQFYIGPVTESDHAERETKSLTLLEHGVLGRRLYEDRTAALCKAHDLDVIYGESRQSELMRKIGGDIDRLRSIMDDVARLEHPHETDETIGNLYYNAACLD